MVFNLEARTSETMRKFLYIKANPKDVSQDEYNHFARTHLLTDGWLFIIDWVYDVEGWNEKEVTADEFNKLNNSNTYG